MLQITFGQRIFLSILGVTAISILLVVVPLLIAMSKNYKEIAKSQAMADAIKIASMTAPAVVFEREDMAQQMLGILKDSESVSSATIYIPDTSTEQLKVFASYGNQSGVPLIKELDLKQTVVQEFSDSLRSIAPIYADENLVGYVQMSFTLNDIREYFQQTLYFVLGAALLAALVGVYFASLSRKTILKPIKGLHSITATIAETKDYSRRAEKRNEDEVGDLITSFNKMLDVIQSYDSAQKEIEFQVIQLNQNLEQKVADRTSELQENMETLSRTVDDLRDTQSRLVEQEKNGFARKLGGGSRS